MKKTIKGIEVELNVNKENTNDCDRCLFNIETCGAITNYECFDMEGGYWSLAKNEQPKTDERL